MTTRVKMQTALSGNAAGTEYSYRYGQVVDLADAFAAQLIADGRAVAYDGYPTTVPEQTLVGRVTGGSVAALTPAQGMGLLGVTSEWHLPLVSGKYFGTCTTFGAALRAESVEVGMFAVPQRSGTLDRLAVYVTIAGSAGALIRLGVRSYDTATGLPGAVLLDAGTVDATATGPLERTISLPVVAGVPIVLTATVQGSASTRPTMVSGLGRTGPWPAAAPTDLSANAQVGCYAASVTGALPASPSWTVGTLGNGSPRIWARMA